MSADQESSPLIPDPPTGLRTIPWRIPILFYRLRLDWFLGNRALLLTHTGRITGKSRQAVLEVIGYDKPIHYVASGFGEKSNWYKNIVADPHVTIQSGGKVIPAIAKVLPINEAEEIFSNYIEKHPNAIKNLAKFIGYKMGDTQKENLDFLSHIPVIAFFPRD